MAGPEQTTVSVFEFIIRGLNPPVVTAIIILLAFEWRAHRKKNWSLLLGGWLFNLVYLYTESFGGHVSVLGISIGEFIGTNLSLVTSALFLAYFLAGDDYRKRRSAIAKAALLSSAVVFSALLISWFMTHSIWTPFLQVEMSLEVKSAIYTPLILFSFISITSSAYRIQSSLAKTGQLARSLVVYPWALYGILQLMYYSKFLDDKAAITYLFGLALLAKAVIAFGLYLLYRQEAIEHNAQQVRSQYEGEQQLAFSWFAHELKSPALSIRLAAETISAEVARRDFTKASKSARRLLEITGNLVTVIESVKLAAEPFDLAKLEFVSVNESISEALGQVRIAKSFHPSAIRTDFAANLYVCAVKENLVQIFTNIIRNGVEAVEGGTDALQLGPAKNLAMSIETKRITQEGGLWVRIRLIDFGPGIPLSMKSDVFRPYVSTKQGINRGLGLWVVQNFLKAFGGRVSIESPLSGMRHGTKFEILLPFATREDQALSPTEYWRQRALRLSAAI